MISFDPHIPLSLYIHFPWCVKKCPYCDFNSHALKEDLPEKAYIDALILNFKKVNAKANHRPIKSIFMGGGTPSLFSPEGLQRLLQSLKEHCQFSTEIEITLEANPGTVESGRFQAYRDIGINRLSLGIQSFNDKHLKILGRIHDAAQAHAAIETVQKAGFSNFNLDLMFGLPEQTIDEGICDLRTAISYQSTHLSWYELTLEPNTYFWHHPPVLPQDDAIFELQENGQALLKENGFAQYEISAYSKNIPCQHNLNYWEFGDYLAIGAGAHGKITTLQNNEIMRYHHFRHPKQYMDSARGFIEDEQVIQASQLPFEYCLNALRLTHGVPIEGFSKRTGLSLDVIQTQLEKAVNANLLMPFSQTLCATKLGYRFLNDLTKLFMPN